MATKTPKQTTEEVVTEVPRERRHFALLSQLDPGQLLKFKSDTTYERIECVGLQPELNMLEAIVQIKQSVGYSGDICSAGSLEYVRFYADFNRDGHWQDLGYGTVRVHDIAGPKPLCYSVKLAITTPQRYCRENNVIEVRAILSWNALPPANTPGHHPVWGNVVDVKVQIEPTRRIPLGNLKSFTTLENLPAELLQVIEDIPAASYLDVAPQQLTLEQRFEQYKDAKVPVDRFAFSEITRIASGPVELNAVGRTTGTSATALQSAGPLAKYISEELIEKLIVELFESHGNTTYEEVNCVGMRPEDDSVAAVLTVKEPNGYSGNLCSAGSPEYVAFWLEIGRAWHYLGMSSVRVHDLPVVPRGGVKYAVVRPVDLSRFTKICTEGPVIGRLRAVLSWNTPPSNTDPNKIPYWGNREDCRVQLHAGEAGTLPRLIDISNVDPVNINAATGLTNDSGSPFGNLVAIHGKMGNFISGRQYKVEVGRHGGPLLPLMNDIQVRIYKETVGTGNAVDCDLAAPGFQQFCVITVPNVGGWYDYSNEESGGVRTVLYDDALGYWATSLLDEGRWDIRVTFKEGLAEIPTETVTIRIDNSAPSVNAELDHHNLGDPQCGKFELDQPVTGTFNASDPSQNAMLPNPAAAEYQHFYQISTEILPSGNPVVMTAGALTGTTLTPGRLGTAGTFTLDTATPHMKACGYVIRFHVSDRTIYGYLTSGAVFQTTSFSNVHDLGFCLG